MRNVSIFDLKLKRLVCICRKKVIGWKFTLFRFSFSFSFCCVRRRSAFLPLLCSCLLLLQYSARDVGAGWVDRDRVTKALFYCCQSYCNGVHPTTLHSHTFNTKFRIQDPTSSSWRKQKLKEGKEEIMVSIYVIVTGIWNVNLENLLWPQKHLKYK